MLQILAFVALAIALVVIFLRIMFKGEHKEETIEQACVFKKDREVNNGRDSSRS